MSHRILRIQKIDLHWEMENPFLFCAHHKDHYPRGNDRQEPVIPLTDRELGEDFAVKDGFRMYHGTKIPGFPMHPHRGFETVTIVTKGVVDHFDSSGAYGRYMSGDVQWLTTGSGCQHSEMFPLVSMESENPLEIFQIWLNLKAIKKMCKPEYRMLWREDIPKVHFEDVKGNVGTVTIIAGQFGGISALEPNANSYALNPEHHVNIFLIEMAPYMSMTLPKVSATLNRNLYFYEGEEIGIASEKIAKSHRIKLDGNESIEIQNGPSRSYLLLLEGEPIQETVVSHGPFVMNTEQEIANAFSDYKHTHFGGWPWKRSDPVNEQDAGRFAKYSDGKIEKKSD